MTAMLLIVSVLILVFGLAATTRTQNITVGGYYSGVIVSEHLCVCIRLSRPSGFIMSDVRDEPPYGRSLRAEFSPHSLFIAAVVRC